MSPERLEAINVELLARPGHEKVRSLIYDLLVNALDIPSGGIDFEKPLPEVRGRADALLGNTVFEFKRDLRAEQNDAEEELTRYLAEREGVTGRQFLGVATDGVRFLTYQLHAGVLETVARPFTPVADAPRRILAWLDTVLAIREEMEPTPARVRVELGRSSLGYLRARNALASLWEGAAAQADVRLKRELWADLLQRVYGSHIDQDELWFQHTYLVIVAKAMAMRVLGLNLTDATDLLSGQPFSDAGISGAVESDFFDWVLETPSGPEWVMRIARQVGRFQLASVEHDILKVLYESLIDPEERHDLGEFYTPDWVADRICRAVIEKPLEWRVLDPACGSGTFLFWAVRRLLGAADEAGRTNRQSLDIATVRVLGIDIHPVAVLIARVTYLLALGTDRLMRDRGPLTVPVYLGDSLQWNTTPFMADREVLIGVPNGGPVLAFPYAVTRNPVLFDRVIDQMLTLSEGQADVADLRAWLTREGVNHDDDLATLTKTYADLRQLVAEERNHIWGYVARNLSRPIWLSSDEQQADVVIGNPPWLSYRFMSDDFQAQFREQSRERNIWAGGRLATQQDLSGLFFVRSAELYLKPGGRIAFVMPLSALTRQQFAGFRTGRYQTLFKRVRAGDEMRERKIRERDLPPPLAAVSFEQPWSFDERVQPLFPVPSCVVFATNTTPAAVAMPPTALAFSGTLPRRDASLDEAAATLSGEHVEVVALDKVTASSPYLDRFHNGATVFPQVLWIVTRVTGRLGVNPDEPLVESRRSRLEKKPWRDLDSLRGQVEHRFLRQLLLGASIAPYRILGSVEAVIPWDDAGDRLLNGVTAGGAGYPRLAEWLRRAEASWNEHGRGRIALIDQLDYYGKLTAQMTPSPIRVVYAKSGTLPAAAVVREPSILVDHMLYWAAIGTEAEAAYLAAILNSETARRLAAHLQSRGQWGARDFHKVIFTLAIPEFEPAHDTHAAISQAAQRAEVVAATVDVTGLHFIGARTRIREALVADGVAGEIDRLVGELLGARAITIDPSAEFAEQGVEVVEVEELEADQELLSPADEADLE